MDNFSPLSEMNYAEHTATLNNMEVEVANTSIFSNHSILSYNFSLLLSQHAHVFIEVVPNAKSMNKIDISSELSLLSAIPYSTNIPADFNLWNRGFVATSLFGTNEFL